MGGDDGEGSLSGLIHALFKEADFSADATCKGLSTNDDLRELALAEVTNCQTLLFTWQHSIQIDSPSKTPIGLVLFCTHKHSSFASLNQLDKFCASCCENDPEEGIRACITIVGQDNYCRLHYQHSLTLCSSQQLQSVSYFCPFFIYLLFFIEDARQHPHV